MKRFLIDISFILIVTIFNLLIMTALQASMSLRAFWTIITTPNSHLAVNGFLIVAFYLIIFALTNRRLFAGALTTIAVAIISIASYLKTSYVEAPLMLSDFSNVKHVNLIISYLTTTHKSIIALFVIFMCIALVYSWQLEKKLFQSSRFELGRILILFCLLVTYVVLYQGDGKQNNFIYLAELVGLDMERESLKTFYDRNGLLVGLLIGNAVDGLKVVHYSEEDTLYFNELKSEKEETASNEVVVYMLAESFFDPSRMVGMQLNENPIPTITQLMQQYTSGNLMLTKEGFGTSLSEYEALTGMTTRFSSSNYETPYYSYLANATSHPFVGQLFGRKLAIHTYNAELYNRKRIYQDVYKFDRFKYDGNPNDVLLFKETIGRNPYISDEAGFQEVLYEIQSIPTDETAFIYYLTMQNHSPYKKDYYEELAFELTSNEGGLNEDEIEQLQIYVQGLHETDQAIARFIEGLNQINRPVTFVFFGDHRPVLSDKLFNQQQKSLTDYFIYQNHQQVKLDYPLISTNYLATVMLKLTSIPKSPFYQFIDKQFEMAPVIFEDQYRAKAQKDWGRITENKELSEMLNYFDIIHADVILERHLLKADFFMNDLK